MSRPKASAMMSWWLPREANHGYRPSRVWVWRRGKRSFRCLKGWYTYLFLKKTYYQHISELSTFFLVSIFRFGFPMLTKHNIIKHMGICWTQVEGVFVYRSISDIFKAVEREEGSSPGFCWVQTERDTSHSPIFHGFQYDFHPCSFLLTSISIHFPELIFQSEFELQAIDIAPKMLLPRRNGNLRIRKRIELATKRRLCHRMIYNINISLCC